MAKQPKIRFTFVLDSPEGALMTAGQWRVWVNRNDVYIADTNLGGIWKASLHDDDAWRVAVTAEAMRGPDRPLPEGSDRAPWKFEPTEFVDGVRKAFAIAATRGAFRPGDAGSRDQRVLAPDRWDRMVYAMVWMTEPGVAFPGDGLLANPLWLQNRRGVWVTQGVQELEPTDPEPVPESQLVEPMNPANGQVLCPGYILRGVHVDRGEGSKGREVVEPVEVPG